MPAGDAKWRYEVDLSMGFDNRALAAKSDGQRMSMWIYELGLQNYSRTGRRHDLERQPRPRSGHLEGIVVRKWPQIERRIRQLHLQARSTGRDPQRNRSGMPDSRERPCARRYRHLVWSGRMSPG